MFDISDDSSLFFDDNEKRNSFLVFKLILIM